MNDFDEASLSVEEMLKDIEKEKKINKIERIEELIVRHIRAHIIIDLKENFYNAHIKRSDRLSYDDIAKKWNVSAKYVKNIAEETGYTI